LVRIEAKEDEAGVALVKEAAHEGKNFNTERSTFNI
jgi:hypothetical protein